MSVGRATRALVVAGVIASAVLAGAVAPASAGDVPAAGPSVSSSAASTVYTYPRAWRSDHVDDYFGVEVEDPYRWLEDPADPRTKRWVAQESNLARKYLDTLPTLESRTAQMTRLLNYPRTSAPRSREDLRFWTHNTGLQSQAVIKVGDSDGGNARVLVDPNTLSVDGTVSVPQWAPSGDGTRLAWATSDKGSDWRTIRFSDVATGEVLPDSLEGARFTSLAWAPDSSGLYYARYPQVANPLEQAARYQAVYFHRLGTPQSADVRVVGDPVDPGRRFWPIVTANTNRLWILGIERDRTYSLHMQDLSAPDAPVVEIVPGGIAEFDIVADTAAGPILKTDYQAANGRIVQLLLADPKPEKWRVIVPESDATINSFGVAGDSIVVSTLRDATSRIDVYAMDGTQHRSVDLPGLGAVSEIADSSGDGPAYLNYSSFTSAPRVYALDGSTATLVPWGRSAAATSTNAPAKRIVTTQEWIVSKDGTRVPAFVIRRADASRDGTNPTLLYGYGGFDIPITPDYQPFVLGWVESGGIYVSANLRGGGEYGKSWHEAGTKLRKQNVFDDYIAIAEWLIDEKWTTPARLAITGRSNGGLLVGAAMTQRPELFGAAIPIVGVMDMLRYHQFTIGASWATDYGRSDDSRKMFRYLRGYSPLHNLAPGVSYPATMVMTADQDDRVVPAHSYKFAATLQHDNANDRPMLIRITTGAGHGGGSSGGGSVQQDISASADRLAFLDASLDGRGPQPEAVFRRR